jgi:methyltransferase (TIGR00027 family)
MAAALVRAAMARPCTPQGDPGAQRRLCAGMQASRRRPPRIVTRTRFFDAQVLEAVSAGVPQVVVCSAGYDDRALRFRSPGVRFFEIDHPATLAGRAGRLHAAEDSPGPVPVPGDFRSDDIADALAAAGHDPARPSVFMCEGLLVYLHRQAVERLLAGLASRAAAGATLVASLATHEEGLDSAQVVAAANARRRDDGGERWLTVLPSSAWLRLLAGTGWQAERLTDPASLDASIPRGFSLLLVARPDSELLPA